MTQPGDCEREWQSTDNITTAEVAFLRRLAVLEQCMLGWTNFFIVQKSVMQDQNAVSQPAISNEPNIKMWLSVHVYLKVAICCDAQAVAGTTEVVWHGRNETNLTLEAWNFVNLQQETDTTWKLW